jgi:hypothetical protein
VLRDALYADLIVVASRYGSLPVWERAHVCKLVVIALNKKDRADTLAGHTVAVLFDKEK